jgi:hypothetical protein
MSCFLLSWATKAMRLTAGMLRLIEVVIVDPPWDRRRYRRRVTGGRPHGHDSLTHRLRR